MHTKPVAQAVEVRHRTVAEAECSLAEGEEVAECSRAAVAVAGWSLALPCTQAVQAHRHLHVKDLNPQDSTNWSRIGSKRVLQD